MAVIDFCPSRQPCADAISVLDTTELRWFTAGPLPSDIGDWFSESNGLLEKRCDTYLLGVREDIGVKRRFRETLELKARLSLDGWTELGDGLAGPIEEWRRWSPAEGLVDVATGGQWVDVCKSIVKRRFSQSGNEITLSSDAQATRAGCDIEVAEVSVGAVQAWTFAFSAFGPQAIRRDALLASWQGLASIGRGPESFGLRVGRAMGYPEWLALADSADL